MKRQTIYLLLPLLAALLMQGSLYSYGIFLTGAVMAVCFLIRQMADRKQKHVPALQGKLKLLLVLLFASTLLSMITAVDRGLAFLGVLHILVILFWIYDLTFWQMEEKAAVLGLLPWAGAAMVFVCAVCALVPDAKSLFWQADRLGGFFQYSNTCGLFLLWGIFVLVSTQKENLKSVILLLILMAGIFLTGSRGSILLLILVLLWNMIRRKTFVKSGLAGLMVLLAGGGIYAVCSGNFQNLGRVFTLIGKSSTIYGRLLYMADALPVILRHPLGLGYMGYSEMQSSFQTGVYTTAFVHNDWLQMALDYGWIFLILCVVLLVLQLRQGKQPLWQKEMLVLTAVYCLVDFHLQYLSIVMVMLLLFDWPVTEVRTDRKKRVSRKGAYTEALVTGFCGLAVFLFFGVSSVCTITNRYDLALTLYPADTYALEGAMSAATDQTTAVELANKRLAINDYSNTAKNILVYAAASDGNYAEALEQKLSILRTAPYALAEYEDFEALEQQVEAYAEANGDANLQKQCRTALSEEQKLLSDAKEKQSPLADHMRDQL